MIRKHANKLQTVLVVGLLTHSAGAKPGFQPTPDECKGAYENGFVNHCEYVKCVCESKEVGGDFWPTENGWLACQTSGLYSCSVSGKGELVCSHQGWCRWYPDELLNPDREPDSPDGPTIGDAGQVVSPVEGGSGIPGAIGGGPGATELVETDTGDGAGAFHPGEVFQAAEPGSWFPPDVYGHGDEFQVEAFLADAPLSYLEALFDLQTAGVVRADIPVGEYYVMKLEADCNGNGMPDAYDIENGTSLDLDQNGKPDECQEVGDSDNFDTPIISDPIADPPAHSENSEADSPVTASDDWIHSPPATDAHTDSPAIYTDTHSNSPPPLQAEDASRSSDLCGSGVGLGAMMLSLCWMLVGAGRGRRTRSGNSNGHSILRSNR